MKVQTLKEYGTDAATPTFEINTGTRGTAIFVHGDMTGETDIAVQIPDGAGGWQDLVIGTSAVILDETNMMWVPPGSGFYRLNIPSTTNSIAVILYG